MKKFLLLLAVSLFALSSLARDFEYDGLSYTVLDEEARTCEVKVDDCSIPGNQVKGNLVIPSIVWDGESEYLVTVISWNAFADCSSLTSVEIPSSVTVIGDEAFADCNSLTSVKIPSSVTEIGYKAFAGCSSLTSVEIPSSVDVIDDEVFQGCSSLTSVEIPSSVTIIGRNVFQGCRSLASVKIPSSVTIIGCEAFAGCSSLASVEIPSSVDVIGAMVFRDCESLTDISVSKNNLTYCSQEGVLFDKTCKVLHTYPAGRKSHYTIPSSVFEIYMGAFAGCGLASVKIPSSVDVIGGYAFADCNSLASVEIPSSVTAIDCEAFAGCRSLTSVEIPSSVTKIGAMVFRDCESLTDISVSKNNLTYCSQEGVLFDKTCKVLHTYPAGRKSHYTIPSSVFEIYMGAFAGCGLASVKIPSSVDVIGGYAFADCNSLTSVKIPSSVTVIDCYAFQGCSSLTSIYYDADTLVEGSESIFESEDVNIYEHATLYVRDSALPQADTVMPWCLFTKRKAYNF